MPIQHGPEPSPAFRVRWKVLGDFNEPIETIDPPRVEEGVLILRTSTTRMLWVPLHTINGTIEVEGI